MGTTNKNAKWIVFILVFVILLCGICFDFLRTDSSFADPIGTSSSSYILMTHTMDQSNYLSTEESINYRILSNIINHQKFSQNQSLFILMFAVLFLAAQSNLLSSLFKSTRKKKLGFLRSLQSILTFIHDQDGQKG